MKSRIIITGWMCMIAILSQAQIRVLNIADNQALANSPAFVDASSNVTANTNQSWGKGLVFPRVDLSTFTLPAITGGYGRTNNFPTYLDGMIVYNTNTGGTAGVGSTDGTLTPGYWYYENKSGSETGGTWKPLGSGNSGAAALTGSASILLAGDSLVRAELTGDVTAGANSNVTAIRVGAVTSAHIADGTVGEADLANAAVTSDKIATNAVNAEHLDSMGASSGQVLGYNGTAWAPAEINVASLASSLKIMGCSTSGTTDCTISPGAGWTCAIMSGRSNSATTASPLAGVTNTCRGSVGNSTCAFLCVK